MDELLRVDRVTKRFGERAVVHDVTFEVRPGEFLTLLGPSGCGKTTTLRMIAGFESPDAGRISLGGRDITEEPPYRRDVHTVFQHYALFPHLDVFENVAFGLRLRRVPEEELGRRVCEALSLVRLPGLERRRIGQLSGGQQQRVALARALVGRPSLLLLDEPLGALDLKLRQAMQLELKELQRRLRIAFVYVTHDQEEAMTLSDRIAVFNAGRIEQLGTPRTIYEEPVSSFVADFVGGANLLAARVTGGSGPRARLRVEEELELEVPWPDRLGGARQGDPVRVSVRPERVRAEAAGGGGARGAVRDVTYLGSETRVVVEAFPSRKRLVAQAAAGFEPALDAPVSIRIDPADVRVLERA